MKQSLLCSKTFREAPKDEEAKNAAFLTRAGYIHKEMAGVYSFLPLGLRVLNKIQQIIREEMDAIGAEELLMSSLQDSALWEMSGRWSDEVSDVWFKTQLKNKTELGLAWTHEEPITRLMKNCVHSYKDLPLYVYQLQTKLRNETRAKSGILRTREFIMKDLYSFSRSVEEHDVFYEKVKESYMKIFRRVGLGDITYCTFASGGLFSKYSHEFQTLTDTGEDTVYFDAKKKMAVNKEVYTDEVLKDLGLEKESLVESSASEVGNIFSLGTRFSDPLGLTYADEDGKQKSVIMGSYGMGPARIMGVIAEVYADEKGLVWPAPVSPFEVHLVSLCKEPAEIKIAEDLYKELQSFGISVLYDDREHLGPGEKFADSDLIGIAKRIVISSRNIAQESVEYKKRNEDKAELIKTQQIVSRLLEEKKTYTY